jgi:ABC-type antimicrobial peptide transport system permease subunit
MSYSVTGRIGEIGIRMALGARRSDVLRMVLSEAGLLISIGILIAIPVAVACGKLVSGLLFDVAANDPFTILLASSTLIAVAVLASLIPARQAASVDPILALRHE